MADVMCAGVSVFGLLGEGPVKIACPVVSVETIARLRCRYRCREMICRITKDDCRTPYRLRYKPVMKKHDFA